MHTVPKLHLFAGLVPGVAFLCACSGTTPGLSNDAGSGAGGNGGITVALGGGPGNLPTPSCSGDLPVTIRDFTSATQHDFEPGTYEDDRDIVAVNLGADDKPFYAGNPTTPTTHGKLMFDQWYNDAPGINLNIPITIHLTPDGSGLYTYDNQDFFPIDGQGFGNEGNDHNFHFTDEVHTQFTYKGGEVFTFTGDDDLWAYVDRKLVINLGGIHSAETASVNLDTLGLTVGQSYALDLFGAERHVTQSHYRIDTTIDCFVPPPAK